MPRTSSRHLSGSPPLQEGGRGYEVEVGQKDIRKEFLSIKTIKAASPITYGNRKLKEHVEGPGEFP